MSDRIWRAKLAAWTHDPAEKALILLRDRAGHEGGTVRQLREILFPEGLPDGLAGLVKRADHWAAAADRPQWPREGRFSWLDQVRFCRNPVLVHPLSGERFRLETLDQVEVEPLKQASFEGFESLIDQEKDARRTALAFWRFGPERPPEGQGLGALWGELPADTRVPDHTIWAHLDLTSAFATAMAADPDHMPALLVVSLGPVQPFIAQARSTSDLWAGSHLLSRMAWEGMKVVAEHLGPDQLLFPQLRGVAEVDLWLRDEVGLPPDLFEDQPWTRMRSDANPLFSASIPNRFVVVVPASEAAGLAGKIEKRVRDWVRQQAGTTLERLLVAAATKEREGLPCHDQVDAQLAGFPEVHWAVVPWSLAAGGGDEVSADGLERLLRQLYPETAGPPGFLGSSAWGVLSQEIDLGDTQFFRPNPGVLYPALYDALDRLAAAAKAVRPFGALSQAGFRCTLCGEREWLTTEREQLAYTRRQRSEHPTLWNQVANKKPSWARRGDHLCALCALKRVWPEMVRERVKDALPDGSYSDRFVVSTHTMAMAPDLEDLRQLDTAKIERLKTTTTFMQANGHKEAAVPKRIHDAVRRDGGELGGFLKGLPTYLDALREGLDSDDEGQRRAATEALATVEGDLRDVLGHTPETYYAILAMDGDHMGAWLAGSEERYRIRYRESWHPQVAAHAGELAAESPTLGRYLDERRPPSPARHMAISAALNAFAQELARPIVEDLYKGKLLYAGGDDVLALVAVDDAVEVATLLRLAYSGVLPGDNQAAFWMERFAEAAKRYRIGGGYVHDTGDRRDGRPPRLYRTMGVKATASCGIAIAHYMTPLARVLKEARAAEHRAKEAGRDRLAVTVMKRGGGDIPLTVAWGMEEASSLVETPAGLLLELRDHLASPEVSRRAAYHVYDWIRQLPPRDAMGPAYGALVGASLRYQLQRQARGAAKGLAELLANRLTAVALRQEQEPAVFIESFLGVAEFLARRGRARTARGTEKEVATHG